MPFDLNDWSLASTDDTTATKAQTAAGVAKSTADTAVTNAATAQSTANTAKKNAATAQSTADAAITDALNAQSTADTAVTNAATAQETADTAITDAANAQSTADSAATAAANAAKTATNYLSYDSTNGLVVGNQTGSKLGGNVQITGDPAIYFRDGTSIMAIFNSDNISLGLGSNTGRVRMLEAEVEIGSVIPTGRTSNVNYISGNHVLEIGLTRPTDSGWDTSPRISVSTGGIYVGSDKAQGATATYDLIRRKQTFTVNTLACTFSDLQAYTMGGMCFVSGQVTPTSAGLNKMLLYIAGVEPMAQTMFPIAKYSDGASEGYVKKVNSGQSHIYFNIPETGTWKFNFAFAIA